MDELKLCPFCGEQHNWETGEDAHYGSGKYIICRNRIIMQAHNNAEIDSRTEHYNTRPLEDALTAEVTALRARVAELEAEARFIPVGERLPEKSYNDRGDEVLAQLGYPYNKVTAMKFIRYDDGDYEFFTGGYGAPSTRWTEHVIGWKPLPAPPEAE